jgi:hypothetical protein
MMCDTDVVLTLSQIGFDGLAAATIPLAWAGWVAAWATPGVATQPRAATSANSDRDRYR